jgi:hypothetical protein
MKFLSFLAALFLVGNLSFAQASADRFNLADQQPAFMDAGNSTSLTSDNFPEGNSDPMDITKRRKKKGKKSSPLAFGVLAGGGLYTISGDVTEGLSNKFGLQAGVLGTYQFSEMVGVKSGIQFIQKGYKMKDDYEEMGVKYEVDEAATFNYINIPLLVTATFGEEIRFYANLGPTFGLFAGGKYKLYQRTEMENPFGGDPLVTEIDLDEKIEDGIKSLDIGAYMGAGLLVPVTNSRKGPGISLLVDFGYNLGLASVSDESDLTMKNNGILFGIGLMMNP